MISSDEESLAGLTQEPSQKRDYDGNFKLRDPEDLVNCTANARSDFERFANDFLPANDASENSAKLRNDELDASSDLFLTPPSTAASSATVGNDTLGISQPLLVGFWTWFFAVYVSNVFFLFKRE